MAVVHKQIEELADVFYKHLTMTQVEKTFGDLKTTEVYRKNRSFKTIIDMVYNELEYMDLVGPDQ